MVLIRTGGEKRLSDFLLWESAYAELLFTDYLVVPRQSPNRRAAHAFLNYCRHRGAEPPGDVVDDAEGRPALVKSASSRPATRRWATCPPPTRPASSTR